MFRQIPPLPTSICSVRYLLCQLQHVPSDTSSANFNMFCQIPPLPTSICYLRQIPPLPTSICSVRYLLCQLQYVLCDFLRSKVFLKSFVPQCNNTISGAKSTKQPLTWWIIPSVVAPGIHFIVVTYFGFYMFSTMEAPAINNLFVI